MLTQKKRHKNIIVSLALLAMGLSFFVQITPLWLKNSDATSLVICTAFGLKTITIDENGNKVPSTPKITNHCVMCLTAAMDYDAPNVKQTKDIPPQAADHTEYWKSKTASNLPRSIQAADFIRGPPQNV